jgi:hypothetical protein
MYDNNLMIMTSVVLVTINMVGAVKDECTFSHLYLYISCKELIKLRNIQRDLL